MNRGKKNGDSGDNGIAFVQKPQMSEKVHHKGNKVKRLVAATIALSPGNGAVRTYSKNRGNMSMIASILRAALRRRFSTFMGRDGYVYICERKDD